MSKVWRMELIGDHPNSGTIFVSTVHYQTDLHGVADEPSGSSVLTELIEHYSTSGSGMQKWTSVICSSLQLTRINVREEVQTWLHEVGEVAGQDLSLAGTLSVTGLVLPLSISPYLHFGTATATRSARGGTHPGPTLSNGLMDTNRKWDTGTGYWSALNALSASIADDLGAAIGIFPDTVDLHPVVYSRTRRKRGDTPYTFRLTDVFPKRDPRWVSRRLTTP